MIVVSANLGRGEDAAAFVRNLKHVIDDLSHAEHAVLCLQEIDEADHPHEHSLTREVLAGFGRHALVGWSTFEPIVVPRPSFLVTAQHVEVSAAGLPGFTPQRHVVEALVQPAAPLRVPPVWVLNNHAPIARPETRSRVAQNLDTFHARVLARTQAHSLIWAGDENDADFPRLHVDERTAVHHGPDWIRYVEHPAGATLDLVAAGVIPMTIDNHDALWAQFKLGRPVVR